MPKLVYLHKRKPALGVEEFHAGLAAACADDPVIPGLARYVQSHTLVRGYARGELLFDAVEEFSFQSEKAAIAFAGSAPAKIIPARRQALVDARASLAMRVDVLRVKDRPVPAGAVKSFEFVNRRPGMELDDFTRHWREVHGPIGAKIPTILRYEQNHLEREAYRGGAAPRFDGFATTWFQSTGAMRAGAGSEAYKATRADEPNFLAGPLPVIITKEVLER